MRNGFRFLIALALATQCVAQPSELFAAARLGDLPKLKLLAGDRAAVALRDEHNRTALHEAAANCRLAAAEFLVQNGWDRLTRDDQGRTPGNLARCPDADVQMGFVRLLMVPMTQEKDPWSIQHAVAYRQTSVLTMLVAMKVDVNGLGSEGNRALDISCLSGDGESTKFLLEHGANPNLRNQTGSTPLHDAALRGNREIIELLLAHGAEINATDSESASTALHDAASFGRLDAVKALVEHGADTTLKTTKGFTALQLATSNGFAEVATFLGAIRKSR